MANSFNRSDQIRIYAQPGLDLGEEQRSEKGGQRPEPDSDAVADSLAKCRINGFEDERLDGERSSADQSSGTSLGDTQIPDPFGRDLRVEKRNRCPRIEGFEVAERDLLPWALAMCLSVEEQQRIPGPVEKGSAINHLQSTGADRMRQDQCAAAGNPAGEPSPNRTTRAARKRDRRGVERRGRLSDRLRHWSRESRTEHPQCCDSCRSQSGQ